MAKEIYKDYDIRKENLTFEDIKRISKSAIVYYQRKGIEGLVIGGDMRESSEAFVGTLVDFALFGGMKVIRVADSNRQECSTPLFNYTCSLHDKYAGIMVTASHNPARYNGLKLNSLACVPISYDDGLNECEELYKQRAKVEIGKSTGIVSYEYPIERLVEETCKQLKLGKNRWNGVNIAFDCANSMSYIDAKVFFDFLGAKVKYINDWLDGTFPAHEANPMVAENLKILRSLVRSGNYLCGATGDGDFDRLGILDEEGNSLDAHIVAALVADYLMKKKKQREGVHAFYTTTMGRIFRDVIKSYGGVDHMVKTGRVHVIKEALDLNFIDQSETILMGAENSRHIMFLDKRGRFYENPLLALGSVIDCCVKEGTSLSKAVEPLLDKYKFLGEQNYQLPKENIPKLMDRLRKEYSKIIKGKLSKKDGILVENKTSFFSVRESNTEPLIRLNVESQSEGETKRITANLEYIIQSFGGTRK